LDFVIANHVIEVELELFQRNGDEFVTVLRKTDVVPL
jgi:hypothetical protein